ncbi:MAG: efflux RND transporter periplasmic adaptor subunit [Verrucomicrobiales bacterium]|nr:efflux RND transporter periplasmic adaptor subunit [Verrucomicrobiales bacterium]
MSLSDLTSNFPDSGSTGADQFKSKRRKRREIPTWLLPVVLIVGFVAVFLLLFGQRFLPAHPVKVATVLTVRSSTAEAKFSAPATGKADGKGELLFQASGWVEPDPYVIEVPVLVNGIVDTVSVLEGETVTKGQVLATLVDDDAKLNYDEATQELGTLQAQIDAHCHQIPALEAKVDGLKKSVEAEQARLSEMQDQYQRLKSLSGGSISEQQIISAKLKAQAQEAEVEKAKSMIPETEAALEIVRLERDAMESRLSGIEIKQARAKLALDRHTIRSPMDGIILNLYAAPGKKRMVNMDDPKSAVIVELFDPAKLQARIDVPLSEAALIAVGQPVELTTDLLPNVTLNGTVTRITGQADIQRNTLQVKVTINEPDERLRPEMLVRGRFFGRPQTETDSAKPDSTAGGRLTLFIPENALTDDQSAWVVTSENQAEKRELQLGREVREDHIQVLEGLRSGEQVILPPHNELKPGLRVRIEK